MHVLDFMGADLAVADTSREFVVDNKGRGDGTYVMHGVGDATGFAPGMKLYTPDGIIWDLVGVDANKKGLTVSKRRDDVSFAAWLTGDWSKLTGKVPIVAPTLVMRAEPALTEAFNKVDWVKKHWPWLVGGGVAIVTLPTILPPIISAVVAARGLRR